jgi:integrase
MIRPHRCVVPFEATGLSPEERRADHYMRIKEGSKGGRLRFIAVDNAQRRAALEYAQAVAEGGDAHLGDPHHDLKRNLRRFDYVMEKFGITSGELGITAHGLRHEALIKRFADETNGEAPPVRGGGALPPEVDSAARHAVAEMAGHRRTRASCAYLGSALKRRADSIVRTAEAPPRSSEAKPPTNADGGETGRTDLLLAKRSPSGR